jgi:uncharacterized membrane protein
MDAPGAAAYGHGIDRTGFAMRIPLRLSLAKTASFAAVHFTVAFGIAYLLTGSIAIASALALLEPLANTVAYFFHERAWLRFMPRSAGLPPAADARLASASK